MTAVMIRVDPHKGSHTAVAIGGWRSRWGGGGSARAPPQAGQLIAWAERTWAVEGATGLGHLQAQELVASGERVLDVPPKLAARVRLLEAGDTGKSNPNDARAIAVAALRSRAIREVRADDHATALKVRARRHRDLGRAHNQVACRLHAVLCDLVPGGIRDAGTVARFGDRSHFAAWNGTAPVQVSSGERKIFRLSLKGNRRVNSAIHIAAVTQIRNRHSDGRAYYDKSWPRARPARKRSAA